MIYNVMLSERKTKAHWVHIFILERTALYYITIMFMNALISYNTPHNSIRYAA